MLSKYCTAFFALCMLLVFSGCGGGEGGSAGATKPTVVSTTPSNGSTTVARDTQEIAVVFSLEMSVSHSIIISADWPISGATSVQWSADHRTFSISRDNAADLLPANTVITIELNPDGYGLNFRDASGNPLDKYTFSFTTGS